MAANIYTGDDSELFLSNMGVDFSTLIDMYIGIVINEKLVKVYKKSELDPLKVILPVTGEAESCQINFVRAETKTWDSGTSIYAELTFIVTDADFPSGKHIIKRILLCTFRKALTADL